MQKVGFIGLGLMGNPMAKNILKKGFPLVVYNRTPAKTKELVSLGATIASTAADLAKQVDVIVTMVTSGKDVEAVLFGDEGVVKGGKKGLIVIDMSTIGPTAAKEIGKKLQESAVDFLDAPVTGSTPKAITGELTIFIGGEEKILEKVRDVLGSMGTHLVYMGPLGSGQAIKLINNYIIAASLVALSEGMLLADGMHLSREKVAKALRQTPNLSVNVMGKLVNYVQDTFPLTFTVANMRKDLGLGLVEMQEAKEHLPLLQQVEDTYAKANEDTLLKGEDLSMIIREIEKTVKK